MPQTKYVFAFILLAIAVIGLPIYMIAGRPETPAIGEANARVFLQRVYPTTPTHVACTVIRGQICMCMVTVSTPEPELSRPFTLRCSCEDPGTGCFLERNQ